MKVGLFKVGLLKLKAALQAARHALRCYRTNQSDIELLACDARLRADVGLSATDVQQMKAKLSYVRCVRDSVLRAWY